MLIEYATALTPATSGGSQEEREYAHVPSHDYNNNLYPFTYKSTHSLPHPTPDTPTPIPPTPTKTHPYLYKSCPARTSKKRLKAYLVFVLAIDSQIHKYIICGYLLPLKTRLTFSRRRVYKLFGDRYLLFLTRLELFVEGPVIMPAVRESQHPYTRARCGRFATHLIRLITLTVPRTRPIPIRRDAVAPSGGDFCL